MVSTRLPGVEGRENKGGTGPMARFPVPFPSKPRLGGVPDGCGYHSHLPVVFLWVRGDDPG